MPAQPQTAPDTVRRLMSAALQLSVLLVCGYGLFYFSYKFYSPTAGGSDFFFYYKMYLHPLDLSAAPAPYVYRQLSALATFGLYKLGVYYPEAISFHGAGVDQRVFFAALASNFLCLIGAAWLTGKIVEALAAARGGAWPLVGSLFCLVSFHSQNEVITGLTEGASWLLLAGTLLAYVTRRTLALFALLALSVAQRETIPLAIATVALVFAVADRKHRAFHLRALAWAGACFAAYLAWRLLSGVHGNESQTNPHALLASLAAFRPTRPLIFQALLTQGTVLLALIAAVAPGAKPRRDWLAALLAAFAVLCLVGVATHIGDNIGRICGILTPGFAALAAQALQSREDTRPLPRQA